MSKFHDLPRHARVAAATLLAILVAGCVRPLAVQHEYFLPLGGSIAKASTRTQHDVSRHRALQAARHGCPEPMDASSTTAQQRLPDGPNLGSDAARKALAQLCDTPDRPPTAAYGGTSNAYQRWVEDRVRELPEVSETAAGAAGGS